MSLLDGQFFFFEAYLDDDERISTSQLHQFSKNRWQKAFYYFVKFGTSCWRCGVVRLALEGKIPSAIVMRFTEIS